MDARESGFERMNLASVSTLHWRLRTNWNSFFIGANWYWSGVVTSLNGRGNDSRPIFDWDQPNRVVVFLCQMRRSSFVLCRVSRPDRFANRRRSSGISTRSAIQHTGVLDSQDTRWE